jgi:hypothetical protein
MDFEFKRISKQNCYPLKRRKFCNVTFFNESQLTEILANASFNKPVHVKISSFKIYELKMSNLLAKDEKESLNLKKCPKELKRTKLYAQLWHNP